MKAPFTDDPSYDGFDSFAAAIVRSVVDLQPPQVIHEQAVKLGETLLPEVIAAAADRQTAHATVRMLAREICDRTPRPDLRFASRKLDRPGRNDLCFCGSARKFKQCCEPLEHTQEFPDLNLLPYVLRCLPRKQWATLVGSAIDRDSVAHAAYEMVEDGDSAAAMALLEPWFASDGAISVRDELLLDLLLDVYTQPSKPLKKKTPA